MRKFIIPILLTIMIITTVGFIHDARATAPSSDDYTKNNLTWIGIGMTIAGLTATLAGLALAIYGYYNINTADKIIDSKLKKLAQVYKEELSQEIHKVQEATQKIIAAYHIQSTNLESAIALYQTAVTICPGVFNGYTSLGYAFLQKGENIKALNAFQKATEIFPNRVESYNDLARVYAILGDKELCLENIKSSLNLDSNCHDSIVTDPVFDKLRQMDSEFDDAFEKCVGNAMKKIRV